MLRHYVIALAISAGAAGALISGAASQGAPAPAGRTATRLPDGRWLLAGGQAAAGVESTLAVYDARTGTTVRLNATLHRARAWHTATILPTGAVLIAGGTGADGGAVDLIERFDPATETLTVLALQPLVPRTQQTATLLTDGRVFVAGGMDGAGGRVTRGEVWDLHAGTATSVLGLQARVGHTASLLADGRVLLSGGGGVDDVFDPRTGRGQAQKGPVQEPNTTELVAESSPRQHARDVPLDTRIAIRFAPEVDPDSLSTSSVVLNDPDGAVAMHLVVAEAGRLAFVWPLNALSPETVYRLTIANARDVAGRSLAGAELTFTTEKAPTPTKTDDADIWTPDPANPDTWRTNLPPSPWQALPALQAEPGVTAVAGQVLTIDGRPLRGVTLEIDAATTRTDSTGRFLLRVSGGGGRRELAIDGRTANQSRKVYGLFEYGLAVPPGSTTVLPFTIWMPRIDVDHAVVIPSPTTAETILTTPYVPGLEVHLPPRTVVRDEDGQPVTRLGITPIPVDRPPFPLAKNVDVPVYFTVQPGGAYVHTYGGGSGAWVVYPNYRRTAGPGQVLQFFHYDPEERDWYVYGVGTVTPDGNQVVPDARTRLYEFTGAMLQTGDPVPGGGWTPGSPGWSDPVDPSTGVFGLHKTDLYLPDVIPIALTRTYNSADSATARPFGRGMTHPYAMFLWSAQQWQQADLILPEGGRIHYVRTSAGTGWADAVFVHQETATTSATPTVWYKSVISWNGNGWNLQRTDGMVFAFGENAPLQRIRDRFGNTLTIARTNGQSGNITRVTSPNGRWIAFTYDASNHVTQATDNIGRTVRYTYNGGNLATVTDAENGVTAYTWTGSSQLATITDPRNIVFLRNTYANERVVSQAGGDGTAVTQFAYTLGASGGVTQTDVTDPRGIVERLVFNGDHYIVSDTRAMGLPEQQTTTVERQAGSNVVTAAVDALGRRTEFQLDASGHVVRVTRLAGTSNASSTVVSYEPKFFQPATVTDPLGHTWTFGFDAAGNLTSLRDPLGRRTTAAYDANGRATSITDALQHTWRFGYLGGDLVSVTDPQGAVQTIFADAAGRTVAVGDPLGATSRFTWNGQNGVTSATDALGAQLSWTLDGNGNITAFTDALGHTTRYAFDAFDRAQSRTDPLTQAETWQYDANDNLTRTVDRKGQVTTYQYDALDRLTLITFADGSTIAYAYDAGSRVTQATDSANGTLTWQYDAFDRVIQESTPAGTVAYTYDADGRRSTMTVSGQPIVSYVYDDSHQLTSVSQGGSTVAITYNDAGQRQSVALPNGVVGGYGYDASGRLTNLSYTRAGAAIGNLVYTYDAAGNLISTDGSLSRGSLPLALAGATYDAANRITAWAGIPFSHDANGNIINDGLHTFQWNARNLLTTANGGVSGVFQYDALGRRRAKTVGGSTTRFLYDGLNIVQEQAGSGLVSANLLTGLALDETFMRTDTAASVLLADRLGSTLGLADATGTLTTQYTFAPFGGTRASGAASANAAQFTGRENDGTGLYYYRARYYAPDRGRFLSEDPLEFGGGDTNLYAYVGNRPTAATDPLGLYNRDVHFDLTGWTGLQVGMCQADAWGIAEANQGIDDDLATSPIVIPNVWARYQFHFTSPERRSQLRRLAFDTGSRYAMGVYLHTLQDSYSHQYGRKDRDGIPYDPILGHLLDWGSPDNPRNRPELWRKMQRETARELWRFHQKNPFCRNK